MQFHKKCNISNSDQQKYTPQMSQIGVKSSSNMLSSNNFINTIWKYPISLVLCVAIFKVSRVTLITGHLQTTDQRNLSKIWVSKATRHVPD